MKKIIYWGMMVLIISGLSSCTTYNYYEAGLNRTNLSNYRTFAWMPSGGSANNANNSNNFIADAKIKDAATAALVEKGLRLQQDNPDLIISYSRQVGRGTRQVYASNWGWGGYGYPGWGMGFGWGGFGGWGLGYRPYYYAYGAPFAYADVNLGKEHYKEGTIVIDLIDRRSRQVVWRGFGVGEVHRDPQKDIDDLPKVVDGVLKQLSLAPSSAPPAGGSGDRRIRPTNLRSS
ncbi:hypothetical protein GCM10027049_24000 [Mucilaginibacter puniceus]